MSCGLFAYIESTINGSFVHAGCTSICFLDDKNMLMSSTTEKQNRCDGLDCCHTTIPSYTNAFKINFTDDDFTNDDNIDMKGKLDGCKYAFVSDQSWLHDNSTAVLMPGVLNWPHVPVVLNWDLPHNSHYVRSLEKKLTSAISNSTVVCNITQSRSTRHESRFFCSCRKGYEGNPYLPTGCQGKVVS